MRWVKLPETHRRPGGIRVLFARRLANSLAIAVTMAGVAQAAPEGSGKSFETCSLVASEYMTTLQLIDRGLDSDQLAQSLPGLSSAGEERVRALYKATRQDGLVETYHQINRQFIECSKDVYDLRGRPEPGKREEHFHFCAGEHSLRYQILSAAITGTNQDEVMDQLPQSRRRIAKAIYDHQNTEGTTAAFDALANELKHCINGTD